MKHQRISSVLFAAALLLCGCTQKDSSSSTQEENPKAETSAAETESAADDNGTGEDSLTIRETLPVQTKDPVGVRGEDGSLNLQKPVQLGESDVFLGFAEQDAVEQLGSGNADDSVTLTPESVSLRELQNTVYANAVYVPCAADTDFAVPVAIGGQTDFSLAELEISYDKDAFAFVGFTDIDGDATCNSLPDEGLLCISFVSTENIQADVELCTLCFRTKTGEKLDSSLKFDVKDIAKWNADRTGYEDVPFGTAGGRIITY